MKEYLKGKYLLLLGLLILAGVYALPNLFGEDPAVQVFAPEQDLSLTRQQVETVLNQEKIPFLSINLDGQERILVRFANEEEQLKGKTILQGKLPEDYIVALNLASRNPKWLTAIGARPMKLGLDLRGGVHFLLSVDLSDMLKKREETLLRSIVSELREAGLRYRSVLKQEPHGIKIYFRSENDLKRGFDLLKGHFQDYTFSSLDDYGLLAQMSEIAIKKGADYATDQTINILRKRVNELGVTEAIVQRQGENGVSIDLPGIQDTARAKDLIGKTATLRFHLLDEDHDLKEAVAGNLPLGSHLYYYKNHPVLLKDQVVLQGSSINYATVSYSQLGQPMVQVRLGGSGESTFARVTRENIGRYLAVVYVEHKSVPKIVNGERKNVNRSVEKIVSIARIQSALGGQFEITGLSSEKYAQNLALLLRSGSLVAPVTVEQEVTVGPSMGQANIQKGFLSIGVGYLCIMVFMALYYRGFGLIANFALLLNLVFVSAILSLLGATLTLPGIAGMVLTAGLAVDASVLVFERIREELRFGRNVSACIDLGYKHAMATIIDANVATLIVASVLFLFGDGAVKGFAVTLIIGLLSSLLTTIVYSRAIVDLFFGKRKVKKLPIGI